MPTGRRCTTLALWLVGVAVTGGCANDGSAPTRSDTSDVGLANPASTFCVAQGGTVDIVDEAGGQVGYCALPDGSRVEEWEYFRANAEP